MSTDTPTDSPPPAPNEGDKAHEKPRPFGNYLLLKELGRGAQGVVYLAEDQSLHRKVALKMLTGAGAQSQVTRDRFRREAELTSRFEHPGICGVRDFGEVEGIPYIAMQFVRGTTLASLVEKARQGTGTDPDSISKSSETITIGGGESKGGLEDVLRLLERAARALHVAHEAGLVHRDIKPANIMVNAEGYPVLLDFGLARDLDSEGQTLTQSGQIMGTPAYLAPEQIVASRGKVDRRTDVYAMGVTLFECLTLQRPFDATSWDALFHEILDGEPRNPRKLNPRIPQDLRTVIEVAMDRDPTRRYPTAEALAEDLRRVRSFEPIQAKAAGPIARLRKWSRRNPGRAFGAVATTLFVASTIGFVAFRAIQHARDLRAYLREANEALVAADYTGATVAVAKAQELDPESPEVRELIARVKSGSENAQREEDRRQALEGAEAARVEAQSLRVTYEDARKRMDELSSSILRDKSGILGRYVGEGVRAELARRERELGELKLEAENARLARSEALERALRLEDPWGGPSLATQRARAGFYLERWREALASHDAVLAEAMRAFVERNDPRGEHRAELLGRGTLTASIVPNDARAYLFRFEEYGTQRPGNVIPRLVPVPTAGVARVREGAWAADFRPGDPCLVVREVAPGSVAERAGLVVGDLILRIAGEPAASSVFVREVAPGSCLANAGVAPLARVADVDGAEIRSPFDWATRTTSPPGAEPKDKKPGRVSIVGRAAPLDCPAREIPIVGALDLIQGGASVEVRVECLHAGASLAFTIPAGASSGLRCEVTANPLVMSESNRVVSGSTIDVDPGSYLLFAAAAGFEEQRYPLLVERGRAVQARVELLPEGDVPAGFVYVPSGPFVQGGDESAFRPRPAKTVEVPGFFMSRRELTNREWYEFVNAPETLTKIAAAPAGETPYLPRDDRVMAKRNAEDTAYVWEVYVTTTADSPVLGLSWIDARDYLEWRNARAAANGERWRYDLPTEDEWEKTARGVDGRWFPWGNRFDPSLAVCLVRQDVYLLDAPGGSEPRDESPFGVLDMAGSREEWLRDLVEDVQPPRYRKRGGHWGSAVEAPFHSASRGEASQDRFASTQGIRLVARRIPQ